MLTSYDLQQDELVQTEGVGEEAERVWPRGDRA